MRIASRAARRAAVAAVASGAIAAGALAVVSAASASPHHDSAPLTVQVNAFGFTPGSPPARATSSS